MNKLARRPWVLFLLGTSCAVYESSLAPGAAGSGITSAGAAGGGMAQADAGQASAGVNGLAGGGVGGRFMGAGGVTSGVGGVTSGVGGEAGGAPAPMLGEDITERGTPIALITVPTGGGNKNLEVLRDGDMPPVGNVDQQRQYDTFTEDSTRSEDWLGYSFTSQRSFMRVTFQNGMLFADGGWFDSMKLQIRSGGAWRDVKDALPTPSYSGDAGAHYAAYQFDFAPATGDAIRVFGTPGGSSRFVSCGELRVTEEL